MDRGIKRCTRAGMEPVGIKDYREVLDAKDVDAVFIATPIYLHEEMAVAAAQAGKHTYCEKPLGRTPEEVKSVHDAVKKAGIRFQVGFQWRYNVVWEETIKKVHEGAIGKVHFVSAHRHAGGYPSSGWYVDRNLSGDLIVEQAVHEMNIFCWLLEGHPLRAAGFGGINALAGMPPERTIMDHYSLSYQFPDNVDLSYSHCVYTNNGVGGLEQLVMGDQAAADLLSGDIFTGRDRIRGEFASRPNDTERAIVSFVDCVRNDKEPLSNVDAGRHATLMSILGRIAIHEKRVAEWSEVAL
jgi:predicted dehydrogenase